MPYALARRFSTAGRTPLDSAVLDALPGSAAILDPRGVIIAVNAAWRAYGTANGNQDPAFGVGQNYLKVCLNAAGDTVEGCLAIHEGLKAVLAGDIKEFSRDYACLSPGAERWQRLIASPLDSRAGPGALVIHLDVTAARTALRRSQESLEQAEWANQSKSRFLAAASHDLRQPLQTIGLLKGVLTQKVQDPEILHHLDQLGDALGAMDGMLGTLLDVDQLETGAIKPAVRDIHLGEIFTQMCSEFRYLTEAKGLALRVVPADLTVRSDRGLLLEILRNLLSNALKYTDSGKVLLGSRRRGTTLRIEVWDTGRGIPEDQHQAIFEEFYQLQNPARDRRRGLGLGLAIVDRLARLLGHRLDLESTPGKGSVFALELPLKPGAAPEGAARPSERPALSAAAAFSVLLVEDDPALLQAMTLFMELHGARVTAAKGGVEALRAFGAGASNPDVIIADHRLRMGETGVQVIRQLREAAGREIPAILVTGETASDQLRDIKTARLPIFQKPVDAERLIACAQELVESAAATQS
jgi:two-component system CheB/CheR fusion protein